jgi:hypothetical protein
MIHFTPPRMCRLGRSGGGASFPAGTLIVTDGGAVAVEDIRVGDRVLSRDEETGETVFSPVSQLLNRISDEMSLVTLAHEDGRQETLRVTPEHPAYVAAVGWVDAGDLQPGDTIEDFDGGAPLKVISVSYEVASERVYNFEVSETHSYFAGDLGAWVHNGFGAYRFRVPSKIGGKKEWYVGKGDLKRAQKSYRDKGGIGKIDHRRACSNRASFKLEHKMMEELGGLKGERLVNKINSPGKYLK